MVLGSVRTFSGGHQFRRAPTPTNRSSFRGSDIFLNCGHHTKVSGIDLNGFSEFDTGYCRFPTAVWIDLARSARPQLQRYNSC